MSNSDFNDKTKIAEEYTLAELRDLFYYSSSNIYSNVGKKKIYTKKEVAEMSVEKLIKLLDTNLVPKPKINTEDIEKANEKLKEKEAEIAKKREYMPEVLSNYMNCPYKPKYENLEDFLIFMKNKTAYIRNGRDENGKVKFERGTIVPLSMTYLCPRDMALLDTLIVNEEDEKYDLPLEEIFKTIANNSIKEPARVDALLFAMRMLPLERQQYYARWFAFKPLGTYLFQHPVYSNKVFLNWIKETNAGQDVYDAIIKRNIPYVDEVLISLSSPNMEFYKMAFQNSKLNIKRIPNYTPEMLALYQRYSRNKNKDKI